VIELERIEIAAWADFYRAATEESAAACRIGVAEVGGGVATVAAAADVLALNRVVGLGTERPVTPEDLDEIVGLFEDAGVRRFFVQPGPESQPELELWLAARGFRHHNNWVKLSRGAEPPRAADSAVRVEPIGPSLAAEFGAICGAAFDWPEPVRAWVGDPVGREGWHHYMAFVGDVPAATGAMYLTGSGAWFDFAATRSEFRGRGAQSALLERRIADALSLGVERFVVETAEQTAERDAPSYRNTVSFGFELAYTRPNYVYEFAG